jgi:peptide deformylase
VEVAFTNAQGELERLELAGFLATVVQHELDHLDGKLYVDRIKDSRLLGFEQEFERYLAPRAAA